MLPIPVFSITVEITEAFRGVDQDTPIIIDSINWATAAWFSVLKPTGDERAVYSLHTYDPDAYTTQGESDDSLTYPSIVEDSGETITFDINWLEMNNPFLSSQFLYISFAFLHVCFTSLEPHRMR